MESNVVPIIKAPTKNEAEKIIKKLILAERIRWTEHAKQRMAERDISILEVRNALSKGKVIDEPYSSLSLNGWETAVERVFGNESLKIGICLKFSQEILVITTIRY